MKKLTQIEVDRQIKEILNPVDASSPSSANKKDALQKLLAAARQSKMGV